MTAPDSAQAQADIDPEALAALSRGECPDGGGPQCVCRSLQKRGQCVSLGSLPKCGTCSDDGLFRIGMSTDICGDCFGTKLLDGRVWDAWDDAGGVLPDFAPLPKPDPVVPAWRWNPSKRRPGWGVVLGPYDAKFVGMVKERIPARSREWSPTLKAWLVRDSHRTTLTAIAEACT